MSQKTDHTPPVVNVSVRNKSGILELNRPRALNSLDQEMVDIVREALASWRDDESIAQVLIFSSSERGFCAGGDVRAVRESVINGDLEAGDRYFIEEFLMNDELGSFPKPIISIIDGVVMGGGLGISMHGSHRVITEKAFASMPEMAIGYTPDVGFTYFGQRASSPAIGAFLAVTGWRMSPEDMIWAGVATHLINSADAENFIETTINTSLESALQEFAREPVASGDLAKIESQIEECFGFDRWELIDAALTTHPDATFVAQVRELMASAAPASVVATIVLMDINRRAETLREGLDNELAISLHMIRQPDFAEGVRAVLVDKDRNASFKPASFEEVNEQVYVDLLSRV